MARRSPHRPPPAAARDETDRCPRARQQSGLERVSRRVSGWLSPSASRLSGSSGRIATAATSTEPAHFPGQRCERRPRRSPQARARSLASPSDRPCGFDDEQRIALGSRNDRATSGRSDAQPTGQRGPASGGSGPRSSSQLSTPAHGAPARAGRRRAVRQFAPRTEHHQSHPVEAAGHVGRQLQTRTVGTVDVLQHQQQRCATGGPSKQRDDASNSRVRWRSGAIAALRTAPRAKCSGSCDTSTARSSGHASCAGGAGRSGNSSRISSAQRPRGALPPRSRAAHVAVSAPACTDAQPQLRRQPGLPSTRLAANRGHGACAGRSRPPRALEVADVLLAADERE